MKTHTYTKDSWQSVTDEIKKHFGWDVLTKIQAQKILSLYIVGAKTNEIIMALSGEDNFESRRSY